MVANKFTKLFIISVSMFSISTRLVCDLKLKKSMSNILFNAFVRRSRNTIFC